MDVRLATTGDAEHLHTLLAQLGYDRSSDALREFLSQPSETQVLVATEGERVIGLLALAIRHQFHQPAPTASVEALVVDEATRSRGVGHELMETACAQAAAAGASLVEVHSSFGRTDAHRFYEREGFVSQSRYFRRELPPSPGSR